MTFNLSDHTTKERRHKEANLSDIVGVQKELPAKYKNIGVDTSALDVDKCLSVKFIRGGGIDLLFVNTEDCELWCKTLNNIVGK